MKLFKFYFFLILINISIIFAQEGSIFEEKELLFSSYIVQGASKHAENPVESPAQVIVITRDEILKNNFKTLDELILFSFPGMWVYTDRIYSYIGSRGTFFFDDYNTRILLLLNGHILNEPWNNFAGLGREMSVPLEIVERVEIIYGPSAILYGGYSLYGIINVITQSPENNPSSEISLSYGSHSTKEFYFSKILNNKIKDDYLSTFFSFGYYGSDGEDLDLPYINLDDENIWGGPQEGTDYEKAPWAFVFSKYKDFTFQGRWGFRKKGNPTGWYESQYGNKGNYIKDDKYFFELNWGKKLSQNTDINFRIFYDNYKFFEKDYYEDPQYYPDEPGYILILPAKNDTIGLEGKLSFWLGKHYITVGSEYRDIDVKQGNYLTHWDGEKDLESEISITSKHKFKLIYFQDEFRPSRKWTFVLAGNYTSIEPGKSIALPRFSGIYKLKEDLSLKFLAGRGYRNPSVIETTYEDIDILPNYDLEPESITTYEFCLIKAFKKDLLNLSFFYNYLKDVIQQEEVETDDGIFYQYQNTGKAKGKGFTISYEKRKGNIGGRVSYTYQEGKVWQGEEYEKATQVPKHLINGNFFYKKKGFIFSISGNFRSKINSSEGHIDDFEGKISSDFIMNLNLGYEFIYKLPMVIQLKVINLFNSEFKQPTSLVITAYSLPYLERKLVLSYKIKF